jgi:hypothetical protein
LISIGVQAKAKTVTQSTITVKITVAPAILVQAPDTVTLNSGCGSVTTTVRSNTTWDLAMYLPVAKELGQIQYRVDGGSWRVYTGSESFILNTQPHNSDRSVKIDIMTTNKVDTELALKFSGNTSAI